MRAPDTVRGVVAGSAIFVVLLGLLVASVIEDSPRRLLVVVLLVWLALGWFSFLPAQGSRFLLAPSRWVVAVVWLVVLPGTALLLDYLLDETRGGAPLALRVVQAALILWPLGVMLYAVRQAVTTPASVYAIVAVVAAMVAIWLVAVAVTRHYAARAGWTVVVGYLGMLAVFVVASFVLQSHDVQNVLGKASKIDPKQLSTSDVATRDRIRAGLAVAGTLAFLVAAGLLLAAAARVPFVRQHVEQSDIAILGPPVAPSPSLGDDALAAWYSPVLRLSDNEKWRESSVATVLVHRLPPTRECGNGCLNVDPRVLEVRRGPLGRVFSDGTLYPIVLPISSRDREAVAKAHPSLASLANLTAKVIEYWLFYPFDDWRAASALGPIDQRHPSDWEFVAVGVTSTNAPLFVGYSEHCGGVWRPWSKAFVVAEDASRSTISVSPDPWFTHHPFVQVAEGSHANYPTNEARAPDWIGCTTESFVARHAVSLVTFVANATETTSADGPIQIPRLACTASARRVLKDGWSWGPNGTSTTTLSGVLVLSGNPPRSPWNQVTATKGPVTTPLETFFVNRHWQCGGNHSICSDSVPHAAPLRTAVASAAASRRERSKTCVG